MMTWKKDTETMLMTKNLQLSKYDLHSTGLGMKDNPIEEEDDQNGEDVKE